MLQSQLINPVFTVSRDDAATWQLGETDALTVSVNGESITLPVQIVDYVAEGCVGYPVGQVPSLSAALEQANTQITIQKPIKPQ